MYPPNFNYVRAGSVAEALSLIASEDDAKFLAGGHSLVPAMKLRLDAPGTLIDIGRIEDLRGIAYGSGDENDCIGPLTTHATIASSNLAAALVEAAGGIGDPQVRNRGTIGGNIAHADPASDLPTVLTALGATIRVENPSSARNIEAESFFTRPFRDQSRGERADHRHCGAPRRSRHRLGLCQVVQPGIAVRGGGSLRLGDCEQWSRVPGPRGSGAG